MEANPGKFRLGEHELQERKDFVVRTHKSVQVPIILLFVLISDFFIYVHAFINVFMCADDERSAR